MFLKYDVLGIGNAIMDVIAPVSDDILADNNIQKGGMTLIDEPRAIALHNVFESASKTQEVAGGSAANTLVGIATQSVRAAYIGKVANDAVGERFSKGLRDAGVAYETAPLKDQDATARCLIAVTPDGERSMSTFLGASAQFGKSEIIRDVIEASAVIYLEGYLFDKDDAKAAFVMASEIAQAAGRKVSLTLSDSFCVDRHRDSFKHLVENHVDILFANEAELLSLYETDDFDTALDTLATCNTIACVTRSEKGSVILAGGDRYTIKAEPVDTVVDTTGAGDQYAAGVLAGRAKGLTWAESGALGSRCAAEVISHYGARPEKVV